MNITNCPQCWDDHPINQTCTMCMEHPGNISIGGTGHCETCWERDMNPDAFIICDWCGSAQDEDLNICGVCNHPLPER